VTKKQKGIMTWILVWAGLLIVVLYSPIGSPDLYYSQNYYMENQSVAVNGAIANAPKGNYAQDNSDVSMDIPDVSSHLNANYSVGSSQSSGGSQGSSYSVQSQSWQNNNSSGSAPSGGGGGSFMTGGGSRGSAGSSGVTMTNGITTMSLTTDLTNNSVRQSVTYSGGTGGTDPGGDPTGNPIPVGDGWGLLLFFGVCYAAFKKRSFLIGLLFSNQPQ
jgi:hypothetical protein